MNFLKVLAIFAAASTPTFVNGATITETTDFPRISLSAEPFRIDGALDVGTNSISGSMTGSCQDIFFCETGDISDSFQFILPNNTEIVAASFTLNSLSAGPDFAVDAFLVEIPDLGIGRGRSTTVFSSGRDRLTLSRPTVSGDFNPGLEGAGFGLIFRTAYQGFGPTSFSFSYTASIEIAEITPSTVPLPAGMPLLLGGLAAFGLIRRKRAA